MKILWQEICNVADEIWVGEPDILKSKRSIPRGVNALNL